MSLGTIRFVRLGGGARGAGAAEINITPLVDVVLVLLIIFMVVTPLLEKSIGVDLPSTEQPESLPPEAVPEQTVVRVDAAGAFFIGDEPTGAEVLEETLRARLARVTKPTERVVFFVSSDSAPYAALVRALDAARRAGATTLGMTESSSEAAQPETR